MDYPQGFAFLFKEYDRIHSTNFTGLRISEKGSLFQKENTSEEHVEFSISSQAMKLDNGETWVYFPVVENDQVISIAVGMLQNDETYVMLGKLDQGEDYSQMVLQKFKLVYLKKILSASANKDTDKPKCGFKGLPPCDIEVVDIPAPSGPYHNTPYLGTNPSEGGGGEGGGCSPYNNCGGGGTTSPPEDPCAKLKAQNKNTNFKAKVDNLKTKTSNTSESGYRVGSPVPGSGQTGAQYQELSNKPGTNELDFKIFNTTYGIMHSHYDGLVPIFSPGDINLFIQLLLNAQANNIPLSEVFLSVVTSQGVYQLRGDGIDVASLSMYTDAQIETFNTEYLKTMGNANISTADLQKEFLKFMKENMNIDGAKLYETNSDGASKQLVLNGNNLSTPNCP